MEGARGLPKTTAENVWKVQQALEDAGVVFIDENGGGPGVRLKDRIDQAYCPTYAEISCTSAPRKKDNCWVAEKHSD